MPVDVDKARWGEDDDEEAGVADNKKDVRCGDEGKDDMDDDDDDAVDNVRGEGVGITLKVTTSKPLSWKRDRIEREVGSAERERPEADGARVREREDDADEEEEEDDKDNGDGVGVGEESGRRIGKSGRDRGR